jgi:hypothetical protein
MRKQSTMVGATALAAVLAALTLRATTLHSVNMKPLIYRAVANVNDLDVVEGMAPPGKVVELWARQRHFKEGNQTDDPFAWCGWLHGGYPILLGWTHADGGGVWRLRNLRAAGTTVSIFPPAAGGDRCLGGILTELLPRACDSPGVNCTHWSTPVLEWLNVRKLTPNVAATTGSIFGAEQTSIMVADGPNDGSEPSDVVDVDQNGVNTLAPGFAPGEQITWRCGGGGNAVCPSVTVHDASTVIAVDPEYPFVLGTIQGHAHGGSIIAAAAIQRGQPIGFSVDVNVRFRGRLDLNLGCDRPRFFELSVPLQW